jgi:hypothetical protein
MRGMNPHITRTVWTAIFMLIFGSLSVPNSRAKVYDSDGSAASVKTLLNRAANGDTITLPAGNFTWAFPVTISKAITLQGAGVGQTTINSTHTGGQAVSVNCVPGSMITIRDFNVGHTTTQNCFFLVTGSGENQFRFTNLSFATGGMWSIWISFPGDTTQGEGPYGLIDHCTFNSCGGAFVRDDPNANPNSWHRPMTFGTPKAVYIEDCTFTATTLYPNAMVATDGDNGARIVFRHNQLQDYCFGTHGADSPGPLNSALQHEVMHNTFTVTDGVSQDLAIQFRGGTGVVFDNTLNSLGKGEYNTLLKLSYFRASAGGGGVCKQDRVYPQDYIGTMQPGSGYRTPGQDPKFPNEPWGSVPVYLWNNHVNAPARFGQVVTGLDGNAAPFMKQGRDYFVDIEKPGYTEFAYPHPLQTGSPPPAVIGEPKAQQGHSKKRQKWGKAKVNLGNGMAEPSGRER